MMTSELVAGRELDAVVAVKVMGWQHWPLDTHLGRITALRNPATGEINPPAFSTDIAAAWQVLERYRAWSLIEDGNGRFTCYLDSNWGVDEENWEHPSARDLMDYRAKETATTAPLAICRAALAVVEH